MSGLSKILEFRPLVLKALENMRSVGQIGSPLEAKVEIHLKDRAEFEIFERYQKQLCFIFIVSVVVLVYDSTISESCAILVSKAGGEKCARCWNYTSDVNANVDYPGICGRCADVVRA